LGAEVIVFLLTSSIGIRSGKREAKVRAAAQFGFDPNPSTVVFHDFSADRKTHAIAGVLSPSVQALKNLENEFLMFSGDTDAIVKNRKYPFFTQLVG